MKELLIWVTISTVVFFTTTLTIEKHREDRPERSQEKTISTNAIESDKTRSTN